LRKKIIKRPFYYFFTSIFIIIIVISIGYIFQKRVFTDNANKQNWLDRQFVAVVDSDLVRPTYVISDIFDVLKFNFFSRGIHVRNLKIDYERLKQEYILLKIENQKLSSIVKYSPTYGKIIATGRVLSDPNSFGAGVFTISVGLKEGVKFGDIVTTQQGLVGKIVKIYDTISIVLPVRHVSSKIIGRVQEQGSLLLMSGRHFKGGVIDYIADTVGLTQGQIIVSVSDGLSMPSGIPIGTIINPYNTPIEVKLAVDFATLDYVTIIRNEITLPTIPETPFKTEQPFLPQTSTSLMHSNQKPINPQ
jgi:cell shape-determining protein MreC